MMPEHAHPRPRVHVPIPRKPTFRLRAIRHVKKNRIAWYVALTIVVAAVLQIALGGCLNHWIWG